MVKALKVPFFFGSMVRDTPDTMARSTVPLAMSIRAWCRATSDDEQAVSIAIDGPFRL